MLRSEVQKTLCLIGAGVAIGITSFFLLRKQHDPPQLKAPRQQSLTEGKPAVTCCKDPEIGVSFEYPCDWQKEESSKENVRIVVCRPHKPCDIDGLSQHEVNVFVELLDGPTQLDEYKDISIRNLTEALAPYSKVIIQQANRVQFAGQDGWEIIYTQKFDDLASHSYELRLWNIFTVVKDKAVCVQYISSRDHEKYGKEVQHIVQTLRVEDIVT